ncbi:hypothetical protein [Thermocatellispora tengchongensis]|nr:hypothetical protein [Thermocatellispora tengchongensis]
MIPATRRTAWSGLSPGSGAVTILRYAQPPAASARSIRASTTTGAASAA